MKTIRIPLGLFVALAVAGCAKEEVKAPVFEEQELTIVATREGEEMATKTYRDDSDGSIWWVPGDAISLFYGSGSEGGSKFTSNATENSKVTNFTGTITAITGGGEISVDETYFWGLYPYSETASCDGSSVTMTLPGEQVAEPGTFATGTFPSLGRSQGLIMGFYNICSGLKFSVTKDGVKKVTLKSNNGELITGQAKVSFVDGVPSAEIIDGSDEVVLEAPAGKYFEVGKYYFIVMYPTKFTNGFTVKLETYTEEATVEKTGSLTAKRSSFGRISNIDASATYERKTGNIPIEDANFKAYLLGENYDTDGDGEISYAEADAITTIGFLVTNRLGITSLQGIEYMTNLIAINCGGYWYDSYDTSSEAYSSAFKYTDSPLYFTNGEYEFGPIGTLESIDVSNNSKLEYLWLYNNAALGDSQGTIDLSHNPNLKLLNICNTMLEYPDLANNSALVELEMGSCRGTSMPDVSNMPQLENFNIEYPKDDNGNALDPMFAVDVSGNPCLTRLVVSSAATSLSDLSYNPLIKEFHDSYTSLGFVDVSSLENLEILGIAHSNVSGEISFSDNPKLSVLYAEGNSISSLELSANDNLRVLNIFDNNISYLTLPSSLEYINCWNNPLNAIDVSEMAGLYNLCCANTGITSLDVTHNTNLKYLAFNDNEIESIDLSANTELEELACWNCGLTGLDLTNNTKLTWLRCWSNQIQALNLSHNLSLGTRNTGNDNENGLWCSPMNDASGNNILDVLYIADGQVIPYVTENRSDDRIPAETRITVSPDSGGGENTGEDDWGDDNN